MCETYLIFAVWWFPLKNISQLGGFFPIYGKIKTVPNHQPVCEDIMYCLPRHMKSLLDVNWFLPLGAKQGFQGGFSSHDSTMSRSWQPKFQSSSSFTSWKLLRRSPNGSSTKKFLASPWHVFHKASQLLLKPMFMDTLIFTLLIKKNWVL